MQEQTKLISEGLERSMLTFSVSSLCVNYFQYDWTKSNIRVSARYLLSHVKLMLQCIHMKFSNKMSGWTLTSWYQMSWYHIEGKSLIKIMKILKSEVIWQSFSIISSKMLNSFTDFNILKKISKSFVATNSHVAYCTFQIIWPFHCKPRLV